MNSLDKMEDYDLLLAENGALRSKVDKLLGALKQISETCQGLGAECAELGSIADAAIAAVESAKAEEKPRQPWPNHNWCVGCTPENCQGCGTEPVERRKSEGVKHEPLVTNAMAIAFHFALSDESLLQSEVNEIKVGLAAALRELDPATGDISIGPTESEEVKQKPVGRIVHGKFYPFNDPVPEGFVYASPQPFRKLSDDEIHLKAKNYFDGLPVDVDYLGFAREIESTARREEK